MNTTPQPFVTTMKKFFGLKDGQSLQEFATELRALDDADRAYFVEQFAVIGISVVPLPLSPKS